MTTQSLFRYGGIAAIVSIVSFILALALPAVTGDPTGAPVVVTYLASLLTSVVTLYALYVLHRREAPTLSLVAFGASVLSSLLSLGADYTNPVSAMMLAVTFLYALAAMLFGWLGLQTKAMPSGVGISALVVGAVALVALFSAVAGARDLAGNLLMLANLVWILWFAWLARFFLASKPVSVQTV